jgi:hypothetical protein
MRKELEKIKDREGASQQELSEKEIIEKQIEEIEREMEEELEAGKMLEMAH